MLFDEISKPIPPFFFNKQVDTSLRAAAAFENFAKN